MTRTRQVLIGITVITALLQVQATEHNLPSAVTRDSTSAVFTWSDNTHVVTSDIMVLTSAQTEIKEWRFKECRFGTLKKGTWTVREIKLTIKCAVKRWDVTGGYEFALDVAQCESGADLMDNSTAGGHIGTFQQSILYWPDRQNKWDPPTWDKSLPEGGANPRANVVVSIRMAHADSGWDDWDDGECA